MSNTLRFHDGQAYIEAGPSDPFPVTMIPSGELVPVGGNLFHVLPFLVPGITAADALDANDAMGSVFSIPVPKVGSIVSAVYYDFDDEGLSKELWISTQTFTGAANDAAFSLSDEDMRFVRGVLTFQNFKDAANCQISESADTPFWYVAPEGKLYMQFKTLGADNIAATAMPRVGFIIEKYAEA